MHFLKRSRPPPTKERGPPAPWALDTPLLYFSPKDPFAIRHACEGVQIFGSIGSGKTSGSGAALAKAFLRAGFGGLVMCAKPEERALWEKYALETGRQQHLVIVSPAHPWKFNWLDYELRREGRGGGLTENVVTLLAQVVEITEGKVQQTGDGAFWTRAMRELLRNAVDLLAMARGTITLEEICRLIADAPVSVDAVASEEWKTHSFTASCLRAADEKPKTPREDHDFRIAAAYWLHFYPSLSDRTRAGIVASFTGCADVWLHGIAWELFATTTNLVPEVSYQNGAVIVLDFPIQEYSELGRIVQGTFKFMWQKAMLRRDTNLHPRPVFLWADEAQNFVSSFDFQYQAVARSARACTAYLTQSMSNYLAVLGSRATAEAHSFLGNLVTKIFHAQSDQITNQYAAELIAQELTLSHSFNSGANNSGTSHSAGGSETIRYKVLPGEFGILSKGGPEAKFQVEGIVYGGGRVFRASRDTYLKVRFEQR